MPTYPDTLYGMGVVMVSEREQLRTIMDSSVTELKAGNCPAAFKVYYICLRP
jgi:hypothetical protein